MSTLRLMAAAVLAVGLAAGLRAEQKVEVSKDKLAGTWEVTRADQGGPQVGAVLTFAKDGKLKLNVRGMMADGSYTVDGNKVSVVLKLGGAEDKTTLTVSKLTDAEMACVDEKGKKVQFKRKK
jgi:uncharacterized protein (TIGR03066 family)